MAYTAIVDYENLLKNSGVPTHIELEAAVELLTVHTKQVLEETSKPLLSAIDHICAKDIFSGFDNPPFNRSPLDGYALNHSDSKGACREKPVTLKVIDEVSAGGCTESEVKKGEAIRIMTGAVIPDGCDCVIAQENTNYGEEMVDIYCELNAFQNFCEKGEDFSKGDRLIKRGEVLTPAHLGILSSIGHSEVRVLRPITVGLACTGDELVSVGAPLTKGKIYNSNLYLLAGRLIELGVEVVPYPPLKDSVDAIAAGICQMAQETDVIITTGGVSVGKKDLMHLVFSKLEVKRLFWKVGIKPGTPTLCGIYKNKPIICLSGSPFAAASAFELLARPVLASLSGKNDLMYKRGKATLEGEFKKHSPVRRFVRARLENEIVRIREGGHASGMLSSMAGCNCLVDIPANSPPLLNGVAVDVIVL